MIFDKELTISLLFEFRYSFTRLYICLAYDIIIKEAPLLNAGTGAPKVNAPTTAPTGQPAKAVPSGNSSASGAYGAYGGASSNQNAAPNSNMMQDNVPCMPIVALNPYNNNWTIKARITNKSAIRSWNNAKGSGTLFSIDLLDDQGNEVRGTFFKEACDKWYPILQQGDVYRFSGGKVKPVMNRQYNNLNSQYEITFDQSSNIAGPIDSSSIKQAHYNFVKISALEDTAVGAVVDVIGFVKEASDLSSITSQKMGGRELFKRDLTIADDTGFSIKCTLWGDKAKDETCGWGDNPIVAFKGVKVGDYQGKNLGCLNNTVLAINPAIDEGKALYEYVQKNLGGDLTKLGAQAMTQGGGGSGGSTRGSIEARLPLSAIKGNNMGYNEKPDYADMKMCAIYYQKDKGEGPWYTSCPKAGGDCKKKVTEGITGQWRCEKCDTEYENCTRRYILSAQCADYSGAEWFTLFNEEATKLIGKSADELYTIKMESEQAYNDIFKELLFKEFLATTRSKAEAVNDETRVKSTIFRLNEIDFVEENKKMVAVLKKFEASE